VPRDGFRIRIRIDRETANAARLVLLAQAGDLGQVSIGDGAVAAGEQKDGGRCIG